MDQTELLHIEGMLIYLNETWDPTLSIFAEPSVNTDTSPKPETQPYTFTCNPVIHSPQLPHMHTSLALPWWGSYPKDQTLHIIITV